MNQIFYSSRSTQTISLLLTCETKKPVLRPLRSCSISSILANCIYIQCGFRRLKVRQSSCQGSELSQMVLRVTFFLNISTIYVSNVKCICNGYFNYGHYIKVYSSYLEKNQKQRQVKKTILADKANISFNFGFDFGNFTSFFATLHRFQPK